MKRALTLLLLASCSSTTTPLRAPQHGPVSSLRSSIDEDATPEKQNLGKHLFFDRRLSGSGQTSCNRCHLYLTSFQDNLTGAVPDSSYPKDSPALTRNTPSFLNIGFAPVFRWDGSHDDLVEVLAFPFAETNMNLGSDVTSARSALKARLTQTAPGYVSLFQAAFSTDITTASDEQVWRLTGRALRAFLTAAVSSDSAFDAWNAGDDTAMTPRQQQGYELFEGKARCGGCHSGPLFSDFRFHNISSELPDASGVRADEGRFLVSGDPNDRGAFLTPSLRGVFATDPYFHDGSALTLAEVVRFKISAAAAADPLADPLMRSPPALSEDEVQAIVEFLKALRGRDVAASFAPPPLDSP